MTPEEEYRSLRPIPSVRYIATGQEEVQKIRPDKLKKKNQCKARFESSGSDEEEKKSDGDENEDDKFLADKPREKVKLQDGACIINFEVQFEEEPEDVVYAGGIKGIRALRK